MADNDLSNLSNAILSTRLPSVHIGLNRSCIVCEKVPKRYLAVGAITICEECFPKTFTSQDPVTQEREKYLELLRKQRKQEEN